MKIDPYKHKERYFKWKETVKDGIPDVSKKNSDLIKNYINDMEYGVNISASNIKGSRSYIRLNTLRDKLIFFARAPFISTLKCGAFWLNFVKFLNNIYIKELSVE